MNKSVAVGLLIGVALGLIGGALIAKSRQSKEDRKPAALAPPSPLAPPIQPRAHDPEPDPELPRLRARVAELEAKLEAAQAKPPPPAPSSAAADGSSPDKGEWIKELEDLFKQGAEAYKSAKFKAMVDALKKVGAEAFKTLGDRLLHAESAGERFLAAALLEDLDDPAAIPFLGQALQKDEDPLVRRMSSHGIAMIGNEQGLPALRTAMASDSDWGVRVNSAYGVAKMGQADGVKTLEDAYRSSTTPADNRLNVFGALADVASPTSAPLFKKVLAESTDITYLYVAIGAAQKLNDVSFVPELNRIAADAKYSTNVREFAKKAAEALSK